MMAWAKIPQNLLGLAMATALSLAPSTLFADCGQPVTGSAVTELASGWTYHIDARAATRNYDLPAARRPPTESGSLAWKAIRGSMPTSFVDVGAGRGSVLDRLLVLENDRGIAVWFRCDLILNGNPPAAHGIDLGIVRDTDAVFFNGTEVGATGRPGIENGTVDIEKNRFYSLPASLWRPGVNHIVVRITGRPSEAGFLGVPRVGPEQPLRKKQLLADLPVVVFSWIYVLVAAFFALFYLFFWHLRENLFFAFYSLFLGFYNLIRSNMRYEWFDSFERSWQTELLLLFSLPFFFFEYLHTLIRLPRSLPVKIIYVIYVPLIIVTFFIGDDPRYWRVLVNGNLILILATIVLILRIIVQNYAAHKHKLRFIFYGFLLLIPFLVWDILSTVVWDFLPRLTVYGFLGFLGLVSLQLSDSILSLYTSIRVQEKELRELERNKTRSIMNISTEFNSIFHNLRDAVRTRIEKKKPGRSTGSAQVTSSIANLENLINDSSLLQMLESNDYSVRRVSFSLQKLANETIDRVLQATMQPRKRITTDLPEEDVAFVGDPDLIATALYHLVENALLYTTGQVEIILNKHESGLRIVVRDEGPGMSPQTQQIVFEKFIRAGDERIPGSGVGLTIVALIAEALEGEVGLESGQSFFSTFVMEIPIRTA